MALPHLLFVHGWAYDAGIWEPVRSRLGGPACTVWERGYFGGADEPTPPSGPYVALGHSFGVMRLLRERPQGCIGLVSMAGFARFTAAEGFPGAPGRVLDRMLLRAAADPAAVIADFRARCGAPGTEVHEVFTDRVMEDLRRLRDGDERASAAAIGAPVLALSGGADAIVSAAMAEASFPNAERATLPGAGHLLPSHADWCAPRIAAFCARLRR
ncbi:MAG TPA: alpha/beta hydrolase [Caulobacteraceae bacterium]|jgi:pimeloyl-[acyl-carrier protein] methyl ester esterase|nr:alpha/beta hydrolase [Caulobacteraceae bacterium]